jgi:mRNA interferase MazF
MVVPITSRVRGHGFEVPLNGKKVGGVLLCQQVKMIDFTEKDVQFAEKAPETVTSDALAKVSAIVNE